MSFKSKVTAAAAALTLVGGVGMAGALTAGTASAATPSCGSSCINVFSKQFGTHKSPNYVVDVLRQGEKVGQPIILFRTANYDPAEDWTVAFQGTVADFYAAKLVSAAVALHYGGLAAGSRMTRRSRTSTRRSAWTPACAWAWPRPRSRRGRDAAAVWRVREHRVDPGLPGFVEHLHPRRVHSADQRLGHQLLPPVRAQLPG